MTSTLLFVCCMSTLAGKLAVQWHPDKHYAVHSHHYHTDALRLLTIPCLSVAVHACRKLAVQWHPDKHPNNQEEASKRFQEIAAAYNRLMSSNEDDHVAQLTSKA
jgi:gamma-glutamyl-gamma-aminobutyrate hydrolase PuuD